MSLRLSDLRIKSAEVYYPILRNAPTENGPPTFSNYNIKIGVTPVQTQSKSLKSRE
jgi:hypothetical protein